MAIKDKVNHQKLTLDVNQNNCLTTLEMKQGDKLSRFIDITLVASGEFIDVNELDNVNTAKIIASMNGELRQNSAATINDDGTVTVEINENALGEAGMLDCEIRVTDSKGGVLSSALFLIRVGRSAAGKNGTVIDVSKGSVKNDHLADDAVTESKIANDAVTTQKIPDKNVTPSKLDRAYWEKNVQNYSITSLEELFEKVGFVNLGGTIAQVAISIDTHSNGMLNGVCLAYGKSFTTGDTIYIINTSTGEFWKIDRMLPETGNSYYVYTIKKMKVTEDNLEDEAVTPEKLDRSYWEKLAETDEYITDINMIFETVGFANEDGNIGVINVKVDVVNKKNGRATTIKGVCYAFGVSFNSGDTVYLSNMTDGSMWKLNRYSLGDDKNPSYSFDATWLDGISPGYITPDKFDRSYWEKNYTEAVFDEWSDLTDYIPPIDKGGTIHLIELNLWATDGYISGMCQVFGLTEDNGLVYYITQLDRGCFWRVVFQNEDYTHSVYKLTEENILRRCYAGSFNKPISSMEELKNTIGNISRGGTMGFVYLDIKNNDKDQFYPDGYILGEFIAVSTGVSQSTFLLGLSKRELWVANENEDGNFTVVRENALESEVQNLIKNSLRTYDVEDKGAEITLTLEQIDALDKMFELAAYKDEVVASVYKSFVSAFGLDKYRAMRTLESGDFIEARLSSYWNPATHTGHDWKQANASLDENGNALADGIPYAYQERADGYTDRTCYPEFDIPAEGGYKYQVYFEANEGVQVALDFYNQNVLDARDKNENWDANDYETNFGWQDSMGKEWEPSKEVNGSPIRAMRLNFSQKNAGIKKVIIYRKKVTEDANS